MWTAEFETIVRKTLNRLADGEPLLADAVMLDFGLDSMKTIDLVVHLEEAFGVMIPDEFLTPDTFRTPANLWVVIESLRTETATIEDGCGLRGEAGIR
jgi:acyl carrier protein